MKEPLPPDPPSGQFLATMQRHRGGLLLDEASQLLGELVEAVNATGKPGSLTITLNLKPATRGQSAMVLTDKITPRLPKIEAEASFWFGHDGQLVKDDPRQRPLNFSPSVVEEQLATGTNQ